MERYPLDPRKVQEIAWSLQDIVDDPKLYTASGRGVKSPITSMARIPGVELAPRTGGGAAAGVSTNMLKNPMYEPTRMSDVARELQKARIDEMLSQIDLNLPSTPAQPSMGVRALQAVGRAAQKFTPAMTLLELLTYSPELNSNEEQELQRIRNQSLIQR
jgi:hypothetical protein